MALVLLDDSLNDFKQEGLLDTQQTAMTGSPTEQTAQNIAATLVGGADTVSDHKGRSTDVVGNNTQRNIGLVALAIGCAGETSHMVGDVHDGVNIEQRVHILANASQTLQAHAGVDVLLNQFGVIALAVVIKLREHVIPDFHEPVAIAAGTAVGLAAAILFATVIVDLRTGAAGASAVLPEVILLTQAGHALFRNADHLGPDIPSFIVVLIDSGVHTLRLQAYPFRRSQELPGPLQRLFLEVIAKGEVAQHLEIGAVTSSLTDVLDIAGTDTLLAGADSSAGRLHLTLEVGLHGGHARVDQQKAGIILRNQRKAGQTQMVLAFKEGQEHLAQFIYAIGFVTHWDLTSKIIYKIKIRRPQT